MQRIAAPALDAASCDATNCNTASESQATPANKAAPFIRHCLGLFDDPLTTQPRKKGALFPMQSKKRRQGKRACLLCRHAEKSCTTSLCASRFRTRSTVSDSQPFAPVYSACSQGGAGGGTCSQSMQRGPVWHDASTPQRIHAAPVMLCKFAQNRAVQALQNRPISTTRNTLQELQAAISNGLVVFRSTPGSAERRNPDWPPRVDALRLCAVGVKFS